MQEMTRDKYETFCEMVREYTEGDDIRTDYSGRGMYGRPCLAVVLTEDTVPAKLQMILNLVLATVQTGDPGDQLFSLDDVMDLMDGGPAARIDSLGPDQVVYWPRVRVAEAVED